MTRLPTLRLLTALMLTTATVTGCDDDGDDNTGGDTGGNMSGATPGDTGGDTSDSAADDDAGDDAADDAGDDAAEGCDPAGMGEEGCPEYNSCAQENCGAEYQECMGAGYMSGDFSGGACETYMSCVADCDCDQACTQACELDEACQSCLSTTIGSCVAEACADEALACS